MVVVGTLLFALGLFFTGLNQLGSQLKELGASRFRTLVTRFTTPEWKALLFGFVSGALMQSSSAAAVIFASMSATGIMPVRKAFPIIAGFNVGNCLLVFLAVINIDVAVLYLAGVAGIGLNFAKKAKARKLFATLLGLGLIFYSITLMKSGVKPLEHEPWFTEAMVVSHNSPTLSVVVGMVLGFIAQSSSVVAMIATSLVSTELLTMPQALIIIYGAAIGSNLFKIILGSTFTGSARQLIRFQNTFNFSGAMAMIALFYLETYLHVPLVMALLERLSHHTGTQVAIAFLLFNVVATILVTVFRPQILRWFDRTLPPSIEEQLSRPKYLLDVDPEDAETAMELLWREQNRELSQIGDYFRTLRSSNSEPALPARTEALHQLGRRVATSARAIMCLNLNQQLLRRLGFFQTRQTILGELSDAAQEAVESIRRARQTPTLVSLASHMHETLETLVKAVERECEAPDEQARQKLLLECKDPGPAVERLWETYLANGATVSTAEREQVLHLTSVVQKNVWLLRRLLRMGTSPDGPRLP